METLWHVKIVVWVVLSCVSCLSCVELLPVALITSDSEWVLWICVNKPSGNAKSRCEDIGWSTWWRKQLLSELKTCTGLDIGLWGDFSLKLNWPADIFQLPLYCLSWYFLATFLILSQLIFSSYIPNSVPADIFQPASFFCPRSVCSRLPAEVRPMGRLLSQTIRPTGKTYLPTISPNRS